MNKKEIRIGVDLHGVIDNYVDLFKRISVIRHLFNMKIFIITGPPIDDAITELSNIGVYIVEHCDAILTIVDFLKSQPGIEMWQDDKNRWWTSDENWWSSKSKICQKLDIDLMIDNTERYKEYFKGTGIKFILYDDMEV